MSERVPCNPACRHHRCAAAHEASELATLRARLAEVEAERDAIVAYVDAAKLACGDDRVTGEPLAQVITRLRARAEAAEAKLAEVERIRDAWESDILPELDRLRQTEAALAPLAREYGHLRSEGMSIDTCSVRDVVSALADACVALGLGDAADAAKGGA